MFNLLLKLLSAALLFVVLFLPSKAWSRDIDSHEKLALLNRATGDSSSSPTSFSTRVDNILDQSSTANRTLIETEDAQMRELNVEALAEDPALVTGYSTATTVAEWQEKQNEKEKNDPEENRGLVKSKLERPERSYMIEKEELFEQNQRDREEYLEKKKADEREAKSKALQEEEELDATGLKNNAFYFGKKDESKNPFIENRYIYVSRLVQDGYDYDKAVDLVNNLTSSDDLVIHLMTVDDYTYGEAMEIIAGL